MNCTGPYYRTGRPVLEACIDEKVDYIDLGDDDDSAMALLELDVQATAAGITALICCGIAPGLVNVLARRLADRLDQVDSIELAWVTSGGASPPEGTEKAGAAVMEHMVHACMGKCVTVRDGRRVEIPAFSLEHVLEFPPPLGRFKVFELGHAETATMPRFIPGVRNVYTMGSLYPPSMNGAFRGVARLVEKGKVEMKDAVRFLMELDAGKSPKDVRLNLAVLRGALSQLLSRDITLRQFGRLLTQAEEDLYGGILVAVTGKKDGDRVRLQVATSERESGDEATPMDESTGTPLAVFASMLLDGSVRRKGVLAPEACIDPDEFEARMEKAMPGMISKMEYRTDRV
jgi:saccharopine dehydrogenase (NAD+, L-lysine-forming)